MHTFTNDNVLNYPFPTSHGEIFLQYGDNTKCLYNFMFTIIKVLDAKKTHLKCVISYEQSLYFSYSASDLDGSVTVPSPHILSMASY